MENEERSSIIKLLISTGVIALIIVLGSLLYNNFIKDGGSKTSNQYVILGNYLILQKTNIGFKQIKSIDDKILEKKYTITDGKVTKDNISIQYVNSNWYFFDEDYNQINMPKFKAATHNLSVKLANYTVQTIINPLDDEYISDFFNNNNISHQNTYKAYQISYDFDRDGEEEYIYTLDNHSLEQTNYTQKAFMFIVKNNKVIEKFDNDLYTVMEIVDLNNDGDYEIIINKGNIDVKTFDSCYQIYNLKNDKVTLKKDCK